jgi:hypothetical protein
VPLDHRSAAPQSRAARRVDAVLLEADVPAEQAPGAGLAPEGLLEGLPAQALEGARQPEAGAAVGPAGELGRVDRVTIDDRGPQLAAGGGAERARGGHGARVAAALAWRGARP